jgi:hypothetical protein
MSKLNLTRRTFLEKEELARFQQFLADSPSENAIIGNTSKWGILRTDFQGDTDFLVEPSANAGRVKIEKAENRALTSDGLRMYQEAEDNILVPNDNLWYWMRIKHKYVNWERGTVSVNQNGELTGTGTQFLEVLRGQGTQVPVRIKFSKLDGSTPTNSGFYEIVDVTNNTNAILTSAIEFQNESDLKLVVIGTTPIGEIVPVEQEQGIYSYDSCEIEIVSEQVENVPPVTGFEQDKTFYIARVRNNAGFVDVQDKRSEWWEFNVVGLTDKLSTFSNLSDVQNKPQALINLGLTTAGINIVKVNPEFSPSYIILYPNGTAEPRTLNDVSDDLEPSLRSYFLRRNQSLADLTDKVAARNTLNVYSKDEVYNKTEAYNKTEVYNQTEIDSKLSTARQNVTLTSQFTLPDASYYCNVTKQGKVFTLSGRVKVNSPTGFTVGTIEFFVFPGIDFRPTQNITGAIARSYDTTTFVGTFVSISVNTNGNIQVAASLEDKDLSFVVSWINL